MADAILTPTLEPSLLSSQVQQRPGHPLDFLAKLRWHGNVRELQGIMIRIAVLSDSEEVRVEDLVQWESADDDCGSEMPRANGDLRTIRHQIEQAAISQAMRTAHGNKSKAARLLGIPRSVLYERLKTLFPAAVEAG